MRLKATAMLCIILCGCLSAGQSAAPNNVAGASERVEINDPAEYLAYSKVFQAPDPPTRAQLATHFLEQYPQSVLKTLVLRSLLMAYQQIKNEDEIVRTARRLLEAEPSDLSALAVLSYAYCQCAARNGAVAKTCSIDASRYGREGLDALGKEPKPPFEMSEQEFSQWKASVRPVFEAAARLATSNVVSLESCGLPTAR